MNGWMDDNGVGHGGPTEVADIGEFEDRAWARVIGYSSDPPARTDVVWFSHRCWCGEAHDDDAGIFGESHYR